PYEFARALWFEEYADSAVAPAFGPKIFLQRVVQPKLFKQPGDEALVQKAIAEDLPPIFTYLEGEVGEGGVIAGTRFSIGDIALVVQFINLRFAGVAVDATRWPKLARYVDHVRAQPSVKKIIDEDTPLLG
ncbi:MAG: glutathione S-transferase family protein, partial [Vicinamibacterales bacterium]